MSRPKRAHRLPALSRSLILLLAALSLSVAGALQSSVAPAAAATGSDCTAVTLQLPSTVAAGQGLTLDATAQCPSPASYAFFDRSSPSVPWTLIRGWGSSSFSVDSQPSWAGVGYQFLAWATDGPLTVPQVQSAAELTFGQPEVAACGAVTASLSDDQAQPGSEVTVNASAQCPTGSTPEYSYFTRPEGDSVWTLQDAWVGPSWSWSAPATTGQYQVLVWVSDGPYTVPQAQQAATLYDGVPSTCTGLTLQSASAPNGGLTVSAQSVCPQATQDEYSYFTGPSAQGPWTLTAAWIGPSWTWSNPNQAYVLVWASDGPYTVPQVQTSLSVGQAGTSACSSVSASLTGGNPAAPASGLTITASADCAGGNPSYSYFTSPNGGGPWTLQDAWVGPNWTWTPSADTSGLYYVIVWATNGPLTTPQVQTELAVPIGSSSECSSVSLSASPAGSVQVGSTAQFTATSNCPAGSDPKYSYFTGPSSSGPWTLQDAWVGQSWTLDTTNLSPRPLYVLAWVSDGPLTVPQAQGSLAYIVAAQPSSPSGSSAGGQQNPSENIAPDYVSSCWTNGYQSLACEQTEIADIDSALASEGLPALNWPSSLYTLPLSEQEFVIANEERIERGLSPISGMASEADANALAGAQAEEDPQTSQLPGVIAAVGNWAEDYGPLGSDFDWMYNDGPGTFNVDCPSAGSSGCWIHRDDILTNTNSSSLAAPSGYTWVAGTACIDNPSPTYLSICDLEFALVPSSGLSYDFTWAQAVALGAPAGS